MFEVEPELEAIEDVETGVAELIGRDMVAVEAGTVMGELMLTFSVGKEVDDSLMTEEILETSIKY